MTTQNKKRTTNAERQREYRARHKENSGRRIDMQVSLDTASHLNLLAKVYNKTKKEIIEELLEKEFKQLVNQDGFDINKYV